MSPVASPRLSHNKSVDTDALLRPRAARAPASRRSPSRYAAGSGLSRSSAKRSCDRSSLPRAALFGCGSLTVWRLASASPRDAVAQAASNFASGGAPTAVTWANVVARFEAVGFGPDGFEIVEGYAAAAAKVNSLFGARDVRHIADAAASSSQAAPVS